MVALRFREGWKYSEDLMVVGNTSTSGRSYLKMTLDDVPDELLEIRAGLRSAPFTETIEAELVYLDDGGCSESDEVEGKIAVFERFDANTNAIGTCNYPSRAVNMRNSGALAAVYVYYDRAEGNGTGGTLALPSVALGTIFGEPLVEWLKAGNTTRALIDKDFTRDYLGVPDLLNASSSRGPGLNWTLKPDISAPGTNITSSILGVDNTDPNEPIYISNFPSLTGTSMAAPHVTGAAGLLRSINPDWTVPQLRSALINTSIPIVKIAGTEADPVDASPNQSGPGRINLTYAHKPGLLFDPPKASFGLMDPEGRKIFVDRH